MKMQTQLEATGTYIIWFVFMGALFSALLKLPFELYIQIIFWPGISYATLPLNKFVKKDIYKSMFWWPYVKMY